MKKLLVGCTALVALGAACGSPIRAASLQELQQEKEQLRKENAELKELLRIQRENAALSEQVRQGVASTHRPPELSVSQQAHPQPLAASAVSASVEPHRPPLEILQSREASGWYAADMPLKALRAVPVRVYDWTGPYAGLNLGWSTGASRATQVETLPNFPVPIAPTVSATENRISPNGIVGGAQIGYNWQGGRHWLVGIEADIQGSDQQDKACGLGCGSGTFGAFSLEGTQSFTQRLDYFGTARARFGFVQDGALFYLTGGGAFGRVRVGNHFVESSTQPPVKSVTVDTETAATKFGWAVGGGVEAALGGGWTGKFEYLYLDLGSLSDTATGIDPFLVSPFTQTTTANFRDHIFRAGVNYRFGTEPAYAYAGPMPMLYAGPAYQWTGFYVGGNIGLGIGTTRTSDTSSAAGSPDTGVSTIDGVLNPFGMIGGAQAGYNWQGGRHWLIGVEGDIQGSNLNDKGCTQSGCFNSGGTIVNYSLEQRLQFFGTARARVGFVNDNLLFYGTGGFAYGRVSESLSLTQGGPGLVIGFGSVASTTDQVGWVGGGGIEAALTDRLTGKVEYLHLDLSSVTNVLTVVQPGFPSFDVTNKSTVRADIVRAGINYRLGP